MSFQNKCNWMSSNASGLADGEVAYDNSTRVESKRSHQWFMDANEPEFFSNKKQALEAANTRSIPGMSNLSVSLWENTTSFPSASGQFTDRLFGSELVRDVSSLDQNVPPAGNMNITRKSFENLFGRDSVGLSMSHTIEDPESCVDYGGIRKVKVNQVRNSDIGMSVSRGDAYNGADCSNSIEASYDRNDSNTMSLGPAYSNRDNSVMSLGPSFCKEHETFISMGHTFNKADDNFISIGRTGHTYNKGEENMLTMAQPFEKADGNFTSMGRPYGKNGSNMIAASHTHNYDKGPGDFFSIGSSYNRDNENVISMGGSTYNKVVGNNIMSVGTTYGKKNENSVLVDLSTYDKRDSNILSMGHNYGKGEGHSISFGGFQDDPETNHSGKDIGNYDMLMSQSSSHPLVAFAQKNLVQSNVCSAVKSALVAGSQNDDAPKHKNLKASKKGPSNNFPSNVKSLLSTGMLDGVSVKYVSWSREKNLRGVIKGTGYLCGCKDCNLTSVLNAYEFERHAGCKTKHPNNHIYFENGKTIYAVVQELKSTPQELLFDAIQNITGSPINQKNFRIWKESYQAATRELQRIYGKEEVSMPS